MPVTRTQTNNAIKHLISILDDRHKRCWVDARTTNSIQEADKFLEERILIEELTKQLEAVKLFYLKNM